MRKKGAAYVELQNARGRALVKLYQVAKDPLHYRATVELGHERSEVVVKAVIVIPGWKRVKVPKFDRMRIYSEIVLDLKFESLIL